MLLGSLLGLGVPAKIVREALALLGIEGLRMRVSSVRRGAIAASYVVFSGPRQSPAERKFGAIRARLEGTSQADPIREKALRVFTCLAEAEARVHGVTPAEVHFHELGALDALGEIVGVCVAVEYLGVDRITASPVALGSGSVERIMKPSR